MISRTLGVGSVSARDDVASRAEGSPTAGDAPPCGTQSWSELAAGAGCAESMSAVAQVQPGVLSGAELVDAIVASEKALSLLAARQMGLLTEFARPGRAGDVSELVAELMDKGGQGRRPDGEIDLDTVETLVQERAASLAAAEVAAALQISPITAGSRVRKAQDLCDGLPATVQALAAGRIDRGRAWLIAERTAPLSPSLREAVQDRILPIAEDRSAGNLRGLLDRAVIAADPHAAENRERKAKHDRELVLRSLPDGMASVRAFAPADAAMSIFTLADLLADRTGTDDDRPVAARRVDAWHDIAEQLLTHGYVDLTDLLDEVDGSGEPGSTEGISGANDEPDQDSFTERDSAATPATSHPVPDPPSGSSDHGDPANAQATSHPVPEAPSGSSGHGGAAATSLDPNPDSSPAEPTATARATDSAGTVDVDESHSGQPLSRSVPGTTTDTAAGAAGASATSLADQRITPDADPAAGAVTPQAAQRPQCPVCAHQPDTVAPDAIGNRERRRASRRATRQGRRPHLTVTLSASTLAGLDRLPGHLEGYGAITAETALMIARSAASITTVLLDPASGSITGTGSRTYRPSQATRDITTTLATTCRFPSCRQPAWRCDLDHRDAFDHLNPGDGGATDAGNLDPLCRAHHWLKHHTGWSSNRGPEHTQLWTSPTGHRYTDPPRTLTLPGELLVPAEGPPVRHPEEDARDTGNTCDTAPGWQPNPKPWRTEIDDEGLRPDWRDAEFGGPFPDTIDLKVLVTTVRGRIERVRNIITAPRPARTQEDNRDHGRSGDEAAARWDVTDPPAEGQRVDPDEPPF